MTRKKIVFIVNGIGMQRCVRRIDEFTEHGYEVEAYGFNRGIKVNNSPKIGEIQEVGYINISLSYIKRIGTIRRGIMTVLDKTRHQDVIYYVFGLDNALVFQSLSKKRFVYEESDLVHTYMGSRLARGLFEWLDKRTIKRAIMTVFTAEGFAQYHFGDAIPKNVAFIPNRLAVSVLDCKPIEKRPADMNHLSIGFVGAIRFNAVMHFAEYFVSHYPQHEFHFFGIVTDEVKEQFDEIMKHPNCFYHGKFSTPVDLPEIYSKIDLVLSTYDTEFVNVRYAEPNKLYESLYFETPIIVSKGTFLGEKVERLNSGYVVDAMSDAAIDDFLKALTIEDYEEKVENIKRFPKSDSVNVNKKFFDKLTF